MNIEKIIIEFLQRSLPLPVSGDVPTSGTSPAFITVEKTGGSEREHIRRATVAVQSWAGSRAEAAELNESVIAAMAELTSLPEISRCELSGDYNFPSLATKHPRYQAVFEIVY